VKIPTLKPMWGAICYKGPYSDPDRPLVYVFGNESRQDLRDWCTTMTGEGPGEYHPKRLMLARTIDKTSICKWRGKEAWSLLVEAKSAIYGDVARLIVGFKSRASARRYRQTSIKDNPGWTTKFTICKLPYPKVVGRA